MISVVIPLYNKEKSVRSTLESVRVQSYADWECIVVDDGSTDKSREVAEQFMTLDFRFKILSQENTGVSAARNAGIMAAQGDYIAFLDADDLWSPVYLEKMVALIADYPGSGLYSIGYNELSGNAIPLQESDDEISFRGRVENPWSPPPNVWTGSVVASKEKILKLGLFDTRMTHGEDLDMWWRLMLDSGLVEDTTCCAYYRLDSENRAMNQLIPLDKHIPYYMDKFSEARQSSADFRRFFDEQVVYRLYPYLFDKRYRTDAMRIAKMLDYSQLKWTMHFRMHFPYLYRWMTGR